MRVAPRASGWTVRWWLESHPMAWQCLSPMRIPLHSGGEITRSAAPALLATVQELADAFGKTTSQILKEASR